jgi:peptidoglycan hydrolase CwlO-like protein
MSSKAQSRSCHAAWVLLMLIAGPVACDPAVQQHQLTSAQSRVDEANRERALVQQQVEDLQAEIKSLTSFGGAEHQAKLRTAMALRKEKEELEVLKKDLDARLEHFGKEARRYRDALAKDKQP